MELADRRFVAGRMLLVCDTASRLGADAELVERRAAAVPRKVIVSYPGRAQ
jgi:hypothetical protein